MLYGSGAGHWPYTFAMTATVRVLEAHEAKVLLDVAEGVFDHPLLPEALTDFFQEPRHNIAVALDGRQGVGMATGVQYVHPDKRPELFVNEVGVADAYQGRGLGRQLVQTLLTHARSLGCVAAWVLTEADNTAARRLYASCGGEEQPGAVMSLWEW